MSIKIQIKDSKTLKDSIEALKKKIADADFDLTQQGVKSIANALLEAKAGIDSADGFAELSKVVKKAIEGYDTPKAKEIKAKIEELERMFRHDPRKGARNDLWLWEKLLKYVWNIILKASGNPSPDAKAPKKEENAAPQDSCQAKDDQDDVAEIIRLLGEAHNLIIEANDLASDLERDGKVDYQLVYDIEDLEASASELDFEGDDGVERFHERYQVEKEWPDEDEDELEDLEDGEGLPMDEDEEPRLTTDPLEAGQWYE